jgi:hypothetical protein
VIDEQSPEYRTFHILFKELTSRQSTLLSLAEYHAGRQRLAFMSEKFRTAFGGMFASFADNFLPLVVDSVEQRLNVQGFRYGTDPKADSGAWDLWQSNGLDALSQLAHRESLIKGDSYAIVWGTQDGTPRVTIESAEQCIVGYAPGDRAKRVAALKSWVDDGGTHAVLFLADGIYRLLKAKTGTGWDEEFPDDPFPLPNPIGVVPVVPLTNRPSLISPYGVSEFLDVIPIQDAINKTLADMLVASEYIAFPQRYAAGLEIPVDDQGNAVPPFNVAIDKLLISEDPATKFGTLPAGDLKNYTDALIVLVQHLATISSTPPHYFNVGGNLPSGDAIKAAEAGLVAKVSRKTVFYGEAWEEVMRLCFTVTGDPKAHVTNGETVWKDFQYRSESELADALVKRSAIGVPREQLWEDAGYSPTQISRFHEMEAADALNSLLAPPTIPKIGSAPVVAVS